MKKRINQILSGLLIGAMIFAFGGCGKDSGAAGAAEGTDELTKVRLAVMTNGFDHYLAVVALEQGIFEKYGLDVEMTEYGRGINTIDAVVNGTADIGNMADYATVNRLGNTLHDTNLVIFSEQSGGGVQNGGLYVAPEYADNLQALDGSKGFISILGTVSDYQTSVAIEYLGLDETKQNIIAADSQQTSLALAQNNEASAIYTSGSAGAYFEKFGWKLAVTSEELGIHTYGYFLTTREYNENNQETLAKFLQASQESFDYIKANLDDTGKFLETKIGIKAEDFVNNWSSITSNIGFTQDGADHLQTMEEWAFAHGSFPESYNVKDFINTDAAKLAFPERVTLEQ